MMLPAVDAQQKMLAELLGTGDYTGMSNDECMRVRKDIEDRIGLEEFTSSSRRRSKAAPNSFPITHGRRTA